MRNKTLIWILSSAVIVSGAVALVLNKTGPAAATDGARAAAESFVDAINERDYEEACEFAGSELRAQGMSLSLECPDLLAVYAAEGTLNRGIELGASRSLGADTETFELMESAAILDITRNDEEWLVDVRAHAGSRSE